MTEIPIVEFSFISTALPMTTLQARILLHPNLSNPWLARKGRVVSRANGFTPWPGALFVALRKRKGEGSPRSRAGAILGPGISKVSCRGFRARRPGRTQRGARTQRFFVLAKAL